MEESESAVWEAAASDPEFVANPSHRCYVCQGMRMDAMLELAGERGWTVRRVLARGRARQGRCGRASSRWCC